MIAFKLQFAIPQFAILRPLRAGVLLSDVADLPPPLRAKLMLALIGLIVLGIGLAMMALLGGRVVKRLARHRTGPSRPLDDAWYKRPLEAEAPADARGAENDER